MTKLIKNSSKVQPRRKQIMLSANEWTELQYRVKSLDFICYPGVAEVKNCRKNLKRAFLIVVKFALSFSLRAGDIHTIPLTLTNIKRYIYKLGQTFKSCSFRPLGAPVRKQMGECIGKQCEKKLIRA